MGNLAAGSQTRNAHCGSFRYHAAGPESPQTSRSDPRRQKNPDDVADRLGPIQRFQALELFGPAEVSLDDLPIFLGGLVHGLGTSEKPHAFA